MLQKVLLVEAILKVSSCIILSILILLKWCSYISRLSCYIIRYIEALQFCGEVALFTWHVYLLPFVRKKIDKNPFFLLYRSCSTKYKYFSPGVAIHPW